MYKFIFFVPDDYVESVKRAVFDAGAGTLGHYRECSWQTLGLGQFRPMPESDPFIGATGSLECVSEFRVEMLCDEALIYDVIKAFKQAHPYEEPAYEVIKLVSC
tara:strand:+ start:9952 stop:10263 length:312 start_codon:yes stop_codon:yes gene_type:complete